jgi:hypothetical protein
MPATAIPTFVSRGTMLEELGRLELGPDPARVWDDAWLDDDGELSAAPDGRHGGAGACVQRSGQGVSMGEAGAAAVGYRRRHPAPAQEGALMAETLDAEQYRQALRLILSELEDLDTAHPVDIGYRLGELKAHLRTLIGESGRPPMLGLGGLEDLARVRKERLGPSSP